MRLRRINRTPTDPHRRCGVFILLNLTPFVKWYKFLINFTDCSLFFPYFCWFILSLYLGQGVAVLPWLGGMCGMRLGACVVWWGIIMVIRRGCGVAGCYCPYQARVRAAWIWNSWTHCPGISGQSIAPTPNLCNDSRNFFSKRFEKILDD